MKRFSAGGLSYATLVVALSSGLVRADDRGAPGSRSGAAAMAPASASLDALSGELSSLEQRERTARARLDDLSDREQRLKGRIGARGRAFYRMTRVGLLSVSDGFRGFVEHAMRVERVRRSLEQDVASLDRLASDKTALLHEVEEVAAKRAPLELEHQNSERMRLALAEAEDRRLAFERAFQSSTGPSDYVAVYGGGVGPEDPAGPSGPAEGFHGMKGRLPFPILGRAEIKTVRREGAAGPGVEMRASIGTPVRAVYAGRVGFADTYGSFGKIVILDHGDRYYTVMGNLASIDVHVGDDVSAGALVGSVGDAGAGPLLYFEIRRGSSTLDPQPWFGL